MSFCSACGVEGSGSFCAGCGKSQGLSPYVASEDPAILQMRAVGERLKTARHGTPALLSFFIPGLGQMMKGQLLLGVMVMIGMFVSALLCFAYVGFLLMPALWIWQLHDAYVNPDAALLAEAERLDDLHRARPKD